MERMLNRVFGKGLTAVSLKDVLDKFESYFGVAALWAAAIIEGSVLVTGVFGQAKGAIPFMAMVNVAMKEAFGLEVLQWAVLFVWSLPNLWLLARKGAGIVPMFIALAIAWEYGNRARFPWVAIAVLGGLAVLAWIISILLPEPAKPSETPDPDPDKEKVRKAAMRKWRRWMSIRRMAIIFTIAVVLIPLGQIRIAGLKLAFVIALLLRILDLSQKHN